MLMFGGDDKRKAFYISNVSNTYELWQRHEVPFEWLGFVLHHTRMEFEHYFNEAIDPHLKPQILTDTSAYQYDSKHGELYQILLKKFANK